MRAPLRHAVVVAASALLFWLFIAIRPADLHHVHKLNRALGDVAVVLLAAIFLIGPLARMAPRTAVALEWRRELGIWAFAAAALHVGYLAQQSLGWDVVRFVQDSAHHGPDGAPSGPLTWRRDAWAAGNWVGLFALLYAILPLATSNGLSQRLLGKAWKRLQDHGHVFYALSMAHLFIFWLLVYPADSPGPAPALFWAVFAAVTVAEGAALFLWLGRRRSRPSAEA